MQDYAVHKLVSNALLPAQNVILTVSENQIQTNRSHHQIGAYIEEDTVFHDPYKSTHQLDGIMHKSANQHFDDFGKKSRSNMKYRIKRINTN